MTMGEGEGEAQGVAREMLSCLFGGVAEGEADGGISRVGLFKEDSGNGSKIRFGDSGVERW